MKTYSPAKVHRDGSKSVKISTDITPSWLRRQKAPSDTSLRERLRREDSSERERRR